MDLIEGSFAVATFIVLALPGIVYVAVRRWARGESAEDRDFGLSFARGVVFAVALTCVYLLAFGESLGAGIASGRDADTLVIGDARVVALTILMLYIVLPAATAFGLNSRHVMWQRIGESRWLRYPRSRHGYTNTPSAWDHAARKGQSSWVKIQKANGDWIGGWVTRGSFVSAYPEPRSIYIDAQYAMTSDGNFLNPVPGAGVFLSISDDDIVVWVRGQQQESEIGASNG